VVPRSWRDLRAIGESGEQFLLGRAGIEAAARGAERRLRASGTIGPARSLADEGSYPTPGRDARRTMDPGLDGAGVTVSQLATSATGDFTPAPVVASRPARRACEVR